MKMVRFEFEGRTPEETSKVALPLQMVIFRPIQTIRLLRFVKRLHNLPPDEQEQTLWLLCERLGQHGWKTEFEKDGKRY